MADLIGNNKLLTDDEEKQQGQSSGSETPGASSAGFVSGSGGSSSQSQQTGPGGTGGWTNIQSYLSANKGGTGSDKYLNEKVNSAFDADKSNLEKTASEAKSSAQSQVQGLKDANTNSKKWVADAAQGYNWDGTRTSAYDDNTGKLKSAISGQYSGPTNYAYTYGDDTTKYGSSLGDEQGYKGLMNDIYKDAAGGQISRGGLDLQQQLDVNNESLAKTRQDLLQRYADLGTQRDTLTGDVNTAIENARTEYGQQQNALKDNLLNFGNELDTTRANLEKNAKAEYGNTYDTRSTADELMPRVGDRADSWLGRLSSNRGISSMGQLQNFLDSPLGQNLLRVVESDPNSFAPGEADAVLSVLPQLDQFYADQRGKYDNTADFEKRQWNTIQDILGTGNAATKGFDAVQRSKNARGQ